LDFSQIPATLKLGIQMNVQTRSTAQRASYHTDPNNQLLSALCEVYDLRLSQVAHADATLDVRNVWQRASARRIIFRENDLHDDVPVICDGWAASIVMLSDGRRQILSFLLPGDMVSTVLLFDPRPNCVTEAITDVRYRMFKRADLKEAMLKHADVFEQVSKAWIEEKHRADQLIVDLGRRTADERIARLILNLWERLAERGVTTKKEPMEMEFPLRQHHIADATVLTPVHVSKVLSEFRRNGLVKISDRSLVILDPTAFRRVALR
jgi:CRP/FNR family transcriptional regulator, anaerobic regulatory protein